MVRELEFSPNFNPEQFDNDLKKLEDKIHSRKILQEQRAKLNRNDDNNNMDNQSFENQNYQSSRYNHNSVHPSHQHQH
jgi:hypothetical protein